MNNEIYDIQNNDVINNKNLNKSKPKTFIFKRQMSFSGLICLLLLLLIIYFIYYKFFKKI
jgi:hypothetical protein